MVPMRFLRFALPSKRLAPQVSVRLPSASSSSSSADASSFTRPSTALHRRGASHDHPELCRHSSARRRLCQFIHHHKLLPEVHLLNLTTTSLFLLHRYYLAACLIAVWASLSDFAMLSGQGWTVTDGCRQFFYAR